MTRTSRRRALHARSAFSLVELLLALVLLGLVATLAARATRWGERVFDALARMVGARSPLRDAAALLPTDLRAASSAGGDLLALSDSAIALRIPVGVSIACTIDPARTRVTLPPMTLASGITLSALADAPQSGDELLAYDAGPQLGNVDDAWRTTTITAATTTRADCVAPPFVDSLLDRAAPRWRLDLSAALPATVGIGAPVRILRRARYKLYASQSRWWLGFADWGGGAWNTIQPVSGPFLPYGTRATSGLALHYFDSTGVEMFALTPPASPVARIDVVARTPSNTRVPGRRGALPDSMHIAIALRNRR